ncbi:TetR family transcriptional regulator [Colwellia sp. MSW7]|jgi:TetR/AcrR family acrAB operon transcriptional repressor|uniref:TetR family transcriptional regulator n=1 Tax=Colwellia maritima TaxID=2912588 RepID=A0ABS9X3N1_9GAMM|nr:TetR family transcriptional regulator [Colwellia maritima]MCI2284839.1 TetR family transcriptional regulator [Colwellia maritima]
MVRKTKEEAIETRNQLLDAAEAVFYDKGYSQTTLMDIAKHVGMTRGAIYWHFKNKVDIFEAMVDRVRLPLDRLAEECADENEPDPLGKLREFSIALLRDITTDGRKNRVMSILFHKFEQNGQAEELEKRQVMSFIECTNRIERSLINAINKGQLPQDLDVYQAAIIKHAYFAGLLNNWLFLPNHFDLNSMIEPLVDNYMFLLHNSPELRIKQ